MKKFQSLAFDTPQVYPAVYPVYPASIPRKYTPQDCRSDLVSVRRSILMQRYSPVDLAGNVNMIEKLVLGGTGTGDLPILSPTR